MKLSCIIPAKNAAMTIEACLNSVVSLCEFVDVEAIVICDGSTDATKSIVERYILSTNIENFSLVMIVTDGIGPGRARNAGLQKSSGDYVWFCDSDDLVLSDNRQILITNIEHFCPDVVWANYYTHTDDQSLNLTKTFVSTKFYQDLPWRDGRILNTDVNSYKVLWNKLYRRQWIINCAASFGTWRTGEDALFNMQALTKDASLLTLSSPIYSYSKATVGSVTHVPEDNIRMIDHRYRLIQQFCHYQKDNDKTQKSVFQTDSYVNQELILLGFNSSSRKLERKELTLRKLDGKSLKYRILHAKSHRLRYFVKSLIAKAYVCGIKL